MKNEISPNKLVDSRRSWLLLLIVFFSLFMVGGLQLSFGTIFSVLVQQFGESKSKTAWVGSLVTLFSSLLCPLSITISQRYGIRVTQFIGGLIFTIAIITTSLVSSIGHMFLTYGTLLGIGTALIYAPSFAIIPTLFDKHVTVAMGITTSANTFGLVFFSFLLPSLFSEVGWQKTLWIIAALGPLICVCGLALPATLIEPGATEVEMKECESSLIVKHPWWKSIKKKAFVLWSIVIITYGMVEFVPLYLVPLCAKEKGMSLSQTKWLNVIFGIACIPGKLASGPISKVLLKRDQCKYFYLVVLFIHSVSSFLVSLNPSFIWLALYMAVNGLLEGVNSGLFFVVTLEIVGINSFASVCGLVMTLGGLAYTTGTPLAGLFYEYFPQIHYLFLAMSATTLIAAILMAIIPCVTPRRVCTLRPDTNDFWRICTRSPNVPRKLPRHGRPFTVEDGKTDILRKQHSHLKKNDLKTVSQTYLVDAEAQVAA